jgi:uncharacterized protein (DUF362 family)
MTTTRASTVPSYRVRAVHCDYHASDEEVYASLKRATASLDRSWAKLRKATTIAVKFNQDWFRGEEVMFEGHRQQLVDFSVVRAVLRLLRENSTATILVADASAFPRDGGETWVDTTPILPILQELGIEYVDANAAPVQWYEVPGGGQMFRRYPLAQRVVEADAVVSVQKMKNHAFMGVTLCLKNLFGLTTMEPLGRPRHYYHHLVRMPYMLADLGRIYDPALNIIDGMVCQAGEEWGAGEHTRLPNILMAGDQVVATDACAAHLMGHDPASDWLTPPFHRDRNALLVAAEGGFGTVDLSEIDFESEVSAPVAAFHAKITDSMDMVKSWRRTTAEQALYYRDHGQRLLDHYAGEYVLLQRGRVRWHGERGRLTRSRRRLSGAHPEEAMWMKYIDPEETEGEHFEVYEQVLQAMTSMVYA